MVDNIDLDDEELRALRNLIMLRLVEDDDMPECKECSGDARCC